MSVTITFHTIREKKPEHEQNIIFLKPFSSFGYTGYETIESVVRYIWEEVNDKGTFTGSFICYDPDDTQPENTVLQMMVGSHYLEDTDLWIDVDEYWNCFEQQEEIK